MGAMGAAPRWERYTWAAGIIFVLGLLAEIGIAVGIPLNQDDSAAKMATELDRHADRLLAIACLSVIYAPAFVVYLWRLYHLLRGAPGPPRTLASLLLVGGVLQVALHGVSDIGITGLLGAKLASFAVHEDPGLAYTLYLMTFALDSVGDVFGSLFAIAAGLLVFRSGLLPRWLGWVAILTGVLFLLQGFGLGGVIAMFGLVLDLIAYVLFVVFVLGSSILMLRRRSPDVAVPGRAA